MPPESDRHDLPDITYCLPTSASVVKVKTGADIYLSPKPTFVGGNYNEGTDFISEALCEDSGIGNWTGRGKEGQWWYTNTFLQ